MRRINEHMLFTVHGHSYSKLMPHTNGLQLPNKNQQVFPPNIHKKKGKCHYILPFLILRLTIVPVRIQNYSLT